MSGHTPGPWSFDYQNDTGPNDDCFVEWYGMDGVFKAERIEDARLIAAAPDLLEALDLLVREQVVSADGEFGKVVFTAIAKARGE